MHLLPVVGRVASVVSKASASTRTQHLNFGLEMGIASFERYLAGLAWL